MTRRGSSHRMIFKSIPAVLSDILILLVLSIPASAPLMAQGFLWGDDFEDPPWRSLEIARALSEGILYPRWSAELFAGYGFPIFNFYAPLSYYPAAILSLLVPIGVLDASKVTFALALLGAGIGAYLLALQILEHRGAALLAGILYLYSPAVIGDVYQRSNLAGAVSMAMLPFVIFCFARLLDRPTLPMTGVTGLLLAILILTHNINCAIGLGMMAILAAFHYWVRRDFRSLPLAILAVSLGIGLAACFWLPAGAEMGLTHGASYDLRGQFVDPLGGGQGVNGSDKYAQTSWGPFDLHPAYPYGDPPFKLGLIQAVLLLAGGAALLVSKKRPAPVVSLYVATLLLFYGHTTWSQWLWDAVPESKLLEFPWRLIRPAGASLAVVASWAVLQTNRRWRRWLMPSLALASILSVMWLAPTQMKPFPFGPVTPQGLIDWQAKSPRRIGTQVQGQFLPLVVQQPDGFGPDTLLKRYGQSFPAHGWAGDTAFLPEGAKAWVLATRKGQNWMEAKIEADETTTVAFHTIYFAGWTAYLDGRAVPIEPSSWTEYEEHRTAALGVCQVEVPAGTHVVTLVFGDTPVRTLGNWVSRVSLILIAILLLAPLWHRAGSPSRTSLLAILISIGTLVVGTSYLLPELTTPGRGQEWVENSTVFDLLAEAKGHRLQLTAPGGREIGDFIQLRTFTIHGDTRPILYMHPPSSASRTVWVPEGARLEYTVGMDPEVWNKSTDGVEFRIAIRDGNTLTPVVARRLNPRSEPQDREWISGTVDLSRFAHRSVEIVLSTDPVASPDYDWGGWADAKIVVH